jgi:hypothetical protein
MSDEQIRSAQVRGFLHSVYHVTVGRDYVVLAMSFFISSPVYGNACVLFVEDDAGRSTICIRIAPDQSQRGHVTIPVVIALRSISDRLIICPHSGQTWTLIQRAFTLIISPISPARLLGGLR